MTDIPNGMGDLFDLLEAERARDKSVDRAYTNAKDWAQDFFALIENLPVGWEGTAEEMRLHLKMPSPPTSPNAIGATVMKAVRADLLRWTGQMRKPTNKKSHARKTQVWERVQYGSKNT